MAKPLEVAAQHYCGCIRQGRWGYGWAWPGVMSLAAQGSQMNAGPSWLT